MVQLSQSLGVSCVVTFKTIDLNNLVILEVGLICYINPQKQKQKQKRKTKRKKKKQKASKDLKMKQVVGICFVLIIFVAGAGRSSAKPFGDCYSKCFDPCGRPLMPDGRRGIVLLAFCSSKCAGQCLLADKQSSSVGLNQDDSRSDFCKLGCVTSKCTKFTTEQDPGLNYYYLSLFLFLFFWDKVI